MQHATIYYIVLFLYARASDPRGRVKLEFNCQNKSQASMPELLFDPVD